MFCGVSALGICGVPEAEPRPTDPRIADPGAVDLPSTDEPGAGEPWWAPVSGVVGCWSVFSPITVSTSRPTGTLGGVALARNDTPCAEYRLICVSNSCCTCPR